MIGEIYPNMFTPYWKSSQSFLQVRRLRLYLISNGKILKALCMEMKIYIVGIFVYKKFMYNMYT